MIFYLYFINYIFEKSCLHVCNPHHVRSCPRLRKSGRLCGRLKIRQRVRPCTCLGMNKQVDSILMRGNSFLVVLATTSLHLHLKLDLHLHIRLHFHLDLNLHLNLKLDLHLHLRLHFHLDLNLHLMRRPSRCGARASNLHRHHCAVISSYNSSSIG